MLATLSPQAGRGNDAAPPSLRLILRSARRSVREGGGVSKDGRPHASSSLIKVFYIVMFAKIFWTVWNALAIDKYAFLFEPLKH